MNRSVVRCWRARLARFAAVACVAALTLTGCDFSVYSLPLPGGADLGDHPYSVRVKFHDVLDLVPQSAVKVDDVTVGKVDKITLEGYTADVTVLLRGDVKLPDNAEAEIRQTSLLGEKFVSLKAPATGASSNRLADGDVIPLARSGRNPEVEEVLGALSLLLNGGGVAQLKTISAELNQALAGREGDVRSLLQQLDVFMGQIDQNKGEIVHAIESLNKLAVSVNRQKESIVLALDELPAAVASIDRQRDDLVRMLRALDELSSVGTRVIRDSKAATIDSLQALAPTLTKLAEAGDALPRSLQVFLTYPFVDAVVGTNPTQARNLHMGDYTNLSVQLDLDLRKPPTLPGLPGPPDICSTAPQLPTCGVVDPGRVLDDLQKCLRSGDLQSKACRRLTLEQLKEACRKPRNKDNAVCKVVNPLPDLGGTVGGLLGTGSGTAPGGSGSSDPGGAGPEGGSCLLGILGKCRTAPRVAHAGRPETPRAPLPAPASGGYDSSLGALLVWGMVQR